MLGRRKLDIRKQKLIIGLSEARLEVSRPSCICQSRVMLTSHPLARLSTLLENNMKDGRAYIALMSFILKVTKRYFYGCFI